jgi:hypothetical protein
MVHSRPQWWDWELEMSPHVAKRMIDRSFSEVDLRTMLEHPKGHRPDIVDGRWLIVAVHHKRTWEIVVEPDGDTKRLVIITAYPHGES